MTVQRRDKRRVRLRIPAGLVLRSTGPGEHQLAVLGVETPRGASDTLVLSDDAIHEYTLLAYHLNPWHLPPRLPPEDGLALQPAGLANWRVIAVLEAAREQADAVESGLAIQAAIFRVTVGSTVEEFDDGSTVEVDGQRFTIYWESHSLAAGLSSGVGSVPGTAHRLTTREIRTARAILARAAELDDEFTPLVGVAIDTTVAPFDDPEVVRALGMAVPGGALKRNGYRGLAILPGGPRRIGPTGDASWTVTDGFWPNWTITDGVAPARPDPRGAAQRIADWEARNGPMRVTLVAPEVRNLFSRSSALDVIQDSWERAGVEVVAIPMIWGDLATLAEREHTIRGRSDNPAAAFAAILVAPPAFAELPDD